MRDSKGRFIKGLVPWNKGKHPDYVQGENHPMYGTHPIAWNKGKKGIMPIPWNKGEHPEYMQGKNHPMWKGGNNFCSNCGKELSGNVSKRCHPCYWQSMKGRKLTKEHIKKSLRRRTPSGLELRVMHIIKKHNLPYRFVGNGKFFIERKNPDFVNTNGEKKAVEVYWKRHKELFAYGGLEGWKKDRIKIFGKYGWKIIFIEGTGLTEQVVLAALKGGY